MTKKEFNNGVKEASSIAIDRSNELLRVLNLSLSINWEYEFDGDLSDAIGVYEGGSVFSGEIVIGFNMRTLYSYMCKSIKSYPWSDPYKMLDEAICTNVYHEMGHGLVELIDDYLSSTDELDELYDANKELFDNVLDNEEDSVEDFAWCFYDNDVESSELWQIIELYLNLCDNGINEVVKMDDVRIGEIIREEIDALDFFNGINKSNGGLTPWDAETKMDRMHPSNASRSNGSVPTRDYGVIRGYNDWRDNFKSVMDYPSYCVRFGVRR